MSASLVGSEMCIRDSVVAVPVQLPPVLGEVRLRVEAVACDLRQRPRTPCLLYTSDAADDM
eukprot:5189289-Alexandrium_andersonii.AAC.1